MMRNVTSKKTGGSQVKKSIWVGLGAIVILTLAGCGTTSGTGGIDQTVTNETGQKVEPSQLPTAVVQLVDKESSRFGVKNPKIVGVTTDIDDATQKPMYQITIDGNFVSGSEHQTQLRMIVLKDGSRGGVRTGDKAFDEDFTMTSTMK